MFSSHFTVGEMELSQPLPMLRKVIWMAKAIRTWKIGWIPVVLIRRSSKGMFPSPQWWLELIYLHTTPSDGPTAPAHELSTTLNDEEVMDLKVARQLLPFAEILGIERGSRFRATTSILIYIILLEQSSQILSFRLLSEEVGLQPPALCTWPNTNILRHPYLRNGPQRHFGPLAHPRRTQPSLKPEHDRDRFSVGLFLDFMGRIKTI